MKGWSRYLLARLANTRKCKSVDPPAGNGTTMRIGRVGKSAAAAIPGIRDAMQIRKMRMYFNMTNLLLRSCNHVRTGQAPSCPALLGSAQFFLVLADDIAQTLVT